MNNGDLNNNKIRVAPFVANLPVNNTNYFPILDNKVNCLKLHSGLVVLQEGESVGEHSTENYEELIIVLSGKGYLEAEGITRAEIGPGIFAYNPPNTKHNVTNSGSEPLRYIYIVTKVL
jgi:quercetin dioxygenase-like cupin family protein